MSGVKHDADKVRLDLMPPDALLEVGRVLTFGAGKYSRDLTMELCDAISWTEKLIEESHPSAIRSVRITLPDTVDLATKSNCGRTTHSTPKRSAPIVERGSSAIRSGSAPWLRSAGHALSRVRAIERLRGLLGSVLSERPHRALQKPDLCRATPARFVGALSGPSVQSMSITVIRQDGSEDCFAVGATTASECLQKILNSFSERNPTSRIAPLPRFDEGDPGFIRIHLSGERNWELGMDHGRLYAAAQRHLLAWHGRDEVDEETGLPHLAHAACCVLMLLALTQRACGRDDRARGTTD